MIVKLLKIMLIAAVLLFTVAEVNMGFWNYIKIPFVSAFGLQTGQKPYKGSGIDNFGKVDENLYRGSQPDKEDYDKLKKTFGIKTIIDLRDDAKSWAKEEAEKAGLIYINIPLSDKDYPTEENVMAVEKAVMDESLYPIFLNCAGGIHRSGLATGIYRFQKYSWGIAEIVKEMKKYNWYSEFGHRVIMTAMEDYVRGN